MTRLRRQTWTYPCHHLEPSNRSHASHEPQVSNAVCTSWPACSHLTLRATWCHWKPHGSISKQKCHHSIFCSTRWLSTRSNETSNCDTWSTEKKDATTSLLGRLCVRGVGVRMTVEKHRVALFFLLSWLRSALNFIVTLQVFKNSDRFWLQPLANGIV